MESTELVDFGDISHAYGGKRGGNIVGGNAEIVGESLERRVFVAETGVDEAKENEGVGRKLVHWESQKKAGRMKKIEKIAPSSKRMCFFDRWRGQKRYYLCGGVGGLVPPEESGLSGIPGLPGATS